MPQVRLRPQRIRLIYIRRDILLRRQPLHRLRMPDAASISAKAVSLLAPASPMAELIEPGQSWNAPPTPPLPPRPPQGAQSFGYGAPSNYRFQYSACTGRRRALLIGINYFGQPNQLHGCINDVTNMSTFLNQAYWYRREDMVILTDDQRNLKSIPNKANILRAMHWLVRDAQPNDSLFVHFSGMSLLSGCGCVADW